MICNINCMYIHIQADFGLCEIVGVSRVCINYTIYDLQLYISNDHPNI